jgi:hypothetical protein
MGRAGSKHLSDELLQLREEEGPMLSEDLAHLPRRNQALLSAA